MRTKNQETGRYTIQSDDGRKFTVVERTAFTEVTTLDQTSPRWLPGLKSCSTTSGLQVNVNKDGTYEVLESPSVICRRV